MRIPLSLQTRKVVVYYELLELLTAVTYLILLSPDFLGSDGGTPSVDLPVGTTAKQLELLINSLLANQESVGSNHFCYS